MSKNFKLASLFFSLLLCFSGVAFGQETTGSIEGYIKDANGAVVPNVSVTIVSGEVTENNTRTSVATGTTRTLTASEDGFFRALQLPPGIYSVTTEATGGFGAATYNNVNVSVGRVTQLDIAVAVSGQTPNVVDVLAGDEAGAIDPTGSQIQTNITTRQIETIPAGTSFDSLLRLSPATRPEGKSGGFQVDGASGSENSFIIDGQDVSNFKSNNLDANNAIPTFLVQELTVKSSGFDAEFGGATGGVVSVVTKGGSNQVRGIFGVEFDTPRLNAGPRPVLARIASPTSPNGNVAEYLGFDRNRGTDFFPTAQLSGPIYKDKVFVLGNFSRQTFNTGLTTNFLTNEPAATRRQTNQENFAASTTYEYGFGRVDANPFSQLRLTGTYLWNPQINEGVIPTNNISIGGSPQSAVINGQLLTGAALAAQQGGRVNSNNTTFQAIYTPTGNLVVSGRYGRSFLNNKPLSYGVPNETRFICSQVPAAFQAVAGCTQGFQNIGNNRLTAKEVSVKENYEFDASYILTGFLGNHQFKGGYQRSKIFTDIDGGSNGSNVLTGQVQVFYNRPISQLAGAATGVTNTPGAIGSGVLQRFGQNATGSNLNQGIYIQDKWQPFRRLTLNLGVRAEKEFIPTFNGVPIQIAYGFGDKIAPRAGFAYDIFGDGKSKIFGSYGKFYDRLKFELPAGSFGGDFFRRDFFEIFPGENFRTFSIGTVLGNFNSPSGGDCPIAPRAGTRTRCHLDLRVPSLAVGDLNPFTQQEFTVGFEKEFFSNYLMTFRYTNKTVLDAVEDAGFFNQFGSEVYNIVNPCKGEHAEIIRNNGYARCVEAERKYNAFQAIVERRFSRGFYFNGNYTFSRLTGNYSGLASSDENGRDDPGVTRYFDIPIQGFAVGTGQPDNGRLATDRPHVLNIYGSYSYDWFSSKANETTVSLFTTAQSGIPITTTVEFLSNEVILNGRGDLGRTEAFTRSDIALSHRYRFGRDDKFAVVFNVNVNNALNEHNVTDYYRLITDIDAGVDLSAEDVGFAGTDAGRLAAINAAITTGVGTQIRNFINSDPTLRDVRYNKPNAFQAPRNIRFGFRFQF